MGDVKRISALVFDQPWAITKGKLEAICAVIDRRVDGIRLEAPAVEAVTRRPPQASSGPGVAVLPVFGVLSQRMNLMTEMSGGTSTEALANNLQALDADETVGAIMLEVDSPGGSVFGIEELVGQIRAISTPIVAMVNGMAASAGYWVASAADEVILSPSGQVGSIGVYAQHRDTSAKNETDGVAVTLISAGEGKVDGVEGPLSDAGRAALQRTVDRYYAQFVSSVAGRRGVDPSVVVEEWKADIVTSERALALGMVDTIATKDETLARLLADTRTRSEDAARLARGRML